MRIKNLLIPLMCLMFAFCLEMPLSSTTANLQVNKGDVSVIEQKEVTKIHASKDSMVQFSEFNVEENQEVKVIQSSSDSILVISINSKEPTRIKSKLSANGTVYLFNPNGIFIDKSAVIEKGTFYFVGSELLGDNIKEALNIKPTSGDVVNHGKIITKKEIHLIGRHVVNSGLIEARECVKISKTNAKNQLSILHTGTIKSKDVFIEAKDGTCEIYGKIDAKNSVEQQYGGNICVLAQNVRLIGAYLDASGTFKGGQINLGGDFEGKGPLFKATRTTVDHTSVLDASAIEYGHGGEIVLWSNELTSFQGEIYARGGRKYGSGGRVETSSKNQLGIYSGKVNVDAACGQPGLWMLDPSNILISDSPTASDDLSLASKYPPESGQQVTISVDAINKFSGGALTLSATNRITIDADISNISSTIDLSLRAGNQIRFKNEKIYVPNGKISFIVENKESGQIICSKNFRGITAHELVMIAPKGNGNGFLVESQELALTPSNSTRGTAKFDIQTDVIGKNNADHKIIFGKTKGTTGAVEIEGDLIGFEVADTQTHLRVLGKSEIGYFSAHGSTQVELLGGGDILERADFENTRGLALGSKDDNALKINGPLTVNFSSLKLKGHLILNGALDADDVKLLGHTHINTQNNPITINNNVVQEGVLANFTANTGTASLNVKGNVYLNHFKIKTSEAPSLRGEVCVCDFTTNAPSLSLSHDLVVAGFIDCRNLTTNGENKKIAFAKGGNFHGKTKFLHSGSTTLGDVEEASFSFEEALNTCKSETFVHGQIYVDGNVAISDLTLLGDSHIHCEGAPCSIYGKIEQEKNTAKLCIETKNDQIQIHKFVQIGALDLKTSSPLKLNVPINVGTFSTTSPEVKFSDHVYINENLHANNLHSQGVDKEFVVYGSAKINGVFDLENEKTITLGRNSDSLFEINNKFSAKRCPLNAKGTFDVLGQVELQQLELLDHTSFLTHGYQFRVEKDISQKGGDSHFNLNTENGEIFLGKEVFVTDLNVQTSSKLYIDSQIDVVNFTSSSPLVTFGNNTAIHGKINAQSVESLGENNKVLFNHGGVIKGDAKIANGQSFTFGQHENDLLEVFGCFDRSMGETVAQGTLHTEGSAVNLDGLCLAGKLNILSLNHEGRGENITFHGHVNGAYPLAINAGDAHIYVNNHFGEQIALAGLQMYAHNSIIGANITLAGQSGEFYTNIKLSNNTKIDDHGREGLFFYGNVDGDFDFSAYSRKLIVLKENIGAKTPLNAVTLSSNRIDLWSSIAANAGTITFDGDVELCENAKLINCGIAGISFNGKLDGDHHLEVKVNDKVGRINFADEVGAYKPLTNLVLVTNKPVSFNQKVEVVNFETSSPLTTFLSDVMVAEDLKVQNVVFDGSRQNVQLCGNTNILGNATFNNKGDLFLGTDDQSSVYVKGDLLRNNGPTYARGAITCFGRQAEFNEFHVIGDLTLISKEKAAINYHFNSLIEGHHAICIANPNGEVYFHDYVGAQHPIKSLDIQAKTLAIQREINISGGALNIAADLKLMNHASIRNFSEEGVVIAGSVNGEWDLSVKSSGIIDIQGALGQLEMINTLSIDSPLDVKFSKKLSVYTLKSSSPTLSFEDNVLIKKEIDALCVEMLAQSAHFTLLEGGHLKGDLKLKNSLGVTILGNSEYTELFTEGQSTLLSGKLFLQGAFKTLSQPMTLSELKLSGPTTLSSCAQGSKGAMITFQKTVDGCQPLIVDSGVSQVALNDKVGANEKLHSLQINGSSIALQGDISLLEGSAQFGGDVFLMNDIVISNEGDSSINFLGHVDGTYALEVFNQHKNGSIYFEKAVGSKEEILSLDLQTAKAVCFPKEIQVGVIKTTSPTLTFADEALVQKEIIAHNFVTTGKLRSVRLLGSGNFTGITSFSNTGSIVLGSSDSSIFNFSGPLSVQESTLMTQGQFFTKGSVDLGELTLKGNTEFISQGHSFTVSGKVSQLSKNGNLSVDVAKEKVVFGNRVDIHNLTLFTQRPVEFDHEIVVFDFKTSSPRVSFNKNTTIHGFIEANNIQSQGSDVTCELLGGGEIKGAASFKNANGLNFGSSEKAILTFFGPLDTTASTLKAKGTIETVNKSIDLGNIEVLADTTIRSNARGSAGKEIYFLGAVNGPKQLRANAGSSKISFENNIGLSTALESLQATASKIEVDCDVKSKDGNVVFAGDVIFTNTTNLTAEGVGDIIFQGTVNVDDKAHGPVDLFIDATGKVEFQKDVGDSKGFNEVVVSRAEEIICRTALKANIITGARGKALEKIEARKENATKKADTSIEKMEAKKEKSSKKTEASIENIEAKEEQPVKRVMQEV